MNRLLRLSTLSRALAIVVAFACIAVAIVPPAHPARGEGAVSLAVIVPENTANVSPAILAQVAQAMYDGVVASGRYDVRGGGPLKIEPSATGAILTPALGAASHAKADQALIADIVKVADGKIYYRMSIYKVDPVTFGRTQVFQQPFPPRDARVFSAQFASDLAVLEAPRTNTATIYYITSEGILADAGSVEGFHLGQRFNVVRGGKKVAEAQIIRIAPDNAAVEIVNPSAGYKAEVGDRLISQEPGPAIPVSGSAGGSNSALNIIALLVGAGAVIAALGHKGNAAPLQCPPPTPMGLACATPPPSGAGTFTVALTNGPAGLTPTFIFAFSKPVLNAASFNFAGTSQLFIQDQIPPAPPGPPQPLNALGGASGTFDAPGSTLTVTVAGSLTPGHAYFIVFTNSIMATDGSSLVFTTFRYPSSGVLASHVRPMMPVNGASNPVVPGNGSAGGSNGNGNSAQPHQPGEKVPHPAGPGR